MTEKPDLKEIIRKRAIKDANDVVARMFKIANTSNLFYDHIVCQYEKFDGAHEDLVIKKYLVEYFKHFEPILKENGCAIAGKNNIKLPNGNAAIVLRIYVIL